MRTAPAKVELICVGTELLEGQVNTHQAYIGRRLRAVGLELARASTLPDARDCLAAAVAEALGRSDALLLCGGLGPTFDDLTREAVGKALGRKLVYTPALFREIERQFARHRLPVPEENKRQAFVIEGARALSNGIGSAPGQLLSRERRGRPPQTIALMPGPYAELAPMFERQILPRLKRVYAARVHAETVVLRLSGIVESMADEKLAFLTARPDDGLRFTILSGNGQVDFHITAFAATRAQSRRHLAAARLRALEAVGEHFFGQDDATLESSLGEVLLQRGWTLAVAESCTGGGVGHRLTHTPGSSRYFLGGVIAYDNALKTRLLGVSSRTLATHGAVSSQCAHEMAAGVRRATGARLGLSVTGVAGPGGGTAQKPVGLVFVGIAGPGDGDSREFELRLGNDRAAIRQRAVAAALTLAFRFSKMSSK